MGAGGAKTPKGDLRLFDHEAANWGGLQAGRVADEAVDVDDFPATTAHEVMVVVRHPRFVECGAVGRLNAPNEPGLAQGSKRRVDCLGRHGLQMTIDGSEDLVGAQVATLLPQHG